MKDIILEFKDVWKTYNEGSDALKGINLILKKNSINIILGPSGGGKTTFLNIASLLDIPSKGKVFINGSYVSNLSKSERSVMRMNEIGIVYQRGNLLPYLNILENTMLPMISSSKDRALKLLKSVHITEFNEYPQKLSESAKQRISLARALVNHPSIILADEPTGELDENDTESFMNLLVDIKPKCPVLMVSNNSDLSPYADNLFSIKNGKLEELK